MVPIEVVHSRRVLFVVIVALAALWSFCTAVPQCVGPTWEELYNLLDRANRIGNQDESSLEVLDLVSRVGVDRFKDEYQDCVEGFLSLILYMSFHQDSQRHVLIGLASEVSRELNPLALRNGLSKWPFFGLLGELHMVWQDGKRATPLTTEPHLRAPCSKHAQAPGIVSSLMADFSQDGDRVSPLAILRGLRPGALVVDAGVFDGTDWSLEIALAGATVLGFEPSSRNWRLFQERFPMALSSRRPEAIERCRGYTLLRVEPGERVPHQPWAAVFPPTRYASCIRQHGGEMPTIGHAYIVGAALGEATRALNITTRYDYTSIMTQGYLEGPKDMADEEVAMVTLEDVFAVYMAAGAQSPFGWIDVLKIDVEGYEMGVLRGAERLLAEGRVKYIVIEFHPGMLGTTGTDPVGLIEFLRYYCFLCHSLKIDRPHSFEDFTARYTLSAKALPVKGLGDLEDLLCQNLNWQPPVQH